MGSRRFPSTVYARRLAAAAAAADHAGLSGLVITPGYDLRYLIGSCAQTFERLTALVLPAAGEPTVVVPRLELASVKESAVTELGLAVQDWVDGDDPYQLVAAALGGAPVRDRRHRFDARAAPAATGRRPWSAAGAGHRRAARAADVEGFRRDRRAAQGRRGHRPRAWQGACFPDPGPNGS